MHSAIYGHLRLKLGGFQLNRDRFVQHSKCSLRFKEELVIRIVQRAAPRLRLPQGEVEEVNAMIVQAPYGTDKVEGENERNRWEGHSCASEKIASLFE